MKKKTSLKAPRKRANRNASIPKGVKTMEEEKPKEKPVPEPTPEPTPPPQEPVQEMRHEIERM